MKHKDLTLFFALLVVALMSGEVLAQDQSDTTKTKMHVVVKNDGTEFIGTIVSQDAREVLIETRDKGEIIIPKHEIKLIRELLPTEFTATGIYIPDEVFSTRYFITTNGLPINKGESYVQWNLYGPDIQFGVGKNFGLGIMTSWIAVPIIGTAKYSIKLGKNTNLGVGALLGTGSWTLPKFSLALPFTALTFGDRKANLTLSGGYGAVTYPTEVYRPATQSYVEDKTTEGRMLFSVAFMFKVGRKVSFVFDSFIVPAGKPYYNTVPNYSYDPVTGQTILLGTIEEKHERPNFSLFVPGIRWQMETKSAFQFGFAGMSSEGETVPFPIPMVQWYRKI